MVGTEQRCSWWRTGLGVGGRVVKGEASFTCISLGPSIPYFLSFYHVLATVGDLQDGQIAAPHRTCTMCVGMWVGSVCVCARAYGTRINIHTDIHT